MKYIYSIIIIFFLSGCEIPFIDKKKSSSPPPQQPSPSYLGYEDRPLSSSLEPLESTQWYINHDNTFYSQNSIDENASIDVGNIFSRYSGHGVTIAIIDDGLDTTHEDLQYSISSTFDLESHGSNVTHTLTGDNHGTSVTGIIGARANGIGIRGVASRAKLIFLKHKNSMTSSEAIELFDKASELGADIINCSWGTGSVSDAVINKIEDLATNGRGGKGVIIVFATGNGGNDYTGDNIAGDESSIPKVISVGATNRDNKRTAYSNYGTELDVVAPGGEHLYITTLDPMLDKGAVGDSYVGIQGTSASAPIVSGVIALMLEKKPTLSRDEIEELLRNNADKIGVEAYNNGRNDYYGYGKINLKRVMNAIVDSN